MRKAGNTLAGTGHPLQLKVENVAQITQSYRNIVNYVVIFFPADGPAPPGARAPAVMVMTTLWSHIYIYIIYMTVTWRLRTTPRVRVVFHVYNAKLCSFLLFNSLWPSDAIWQQRSGSTLAQVMAYCLTAPSHYLNQCLLIIIWSLVIFTVGQFYKRCLNHQSLKSIWKLHI